MLGGMRTALVVFGVMTATVAQAQYKCTAPNGAISIQQAPCAAAERAEKLRLDPVAADPTPERIRTAIARGSVVLGMTRAHVDRAAGAPPVKVNTAVHEGNVVTQQLVYVLDGRRTYVYLRNGVVTSFSGDD